MFVCAKDRFELCKVYDKCVRFNEFMSLKYANLVVKESCFVLIYLL